MNGKDYPDNTLSQDAQLYIAELQTYLRTLAHDNNDLPLVAVDGVYGPETRAAVTRFQQINALPATGVVDRATWDAIYRAYRDVVDRAADAEPIRVIFPPNRVLRQGDSGALVRLLQEMLIALALRFDNITDITRSGVFDSMTAEAVRDVQRINGIEPTGELDADSWDALAKLYNRTVAASA